ncbi:hypothetical protein [Chromobacterium amazonense]|nr:hypothetical protein [Chromobacterium amazonense]
MRIWYLQFDGRDYVVDDHVRSGFHELDSCEAASKGEAWLMLMEDCLWRD